MKAEVPVKVPLRCPECEERSWFPVAELVPGRRLPCPHCGTELMVSHDRDTPDGPPVWRLETPEPADERRPRP